MKENIALFLILDKDTQRDKTYWVMNVIEQAFRCAGDINIQTKTVFVDCPMIYIRFGRRTSSTTHDHFRMRYPCLAIPSAYLARSLYRTKYSARPVQSTRRCYYGRCYPKSQTCFFVQFRPKLIRKPANRMRYVKRKLHMPLFFYRLFQGAETETTAKMNRFFSHKKLWRTV